MFLAAVHFQRDGAAIGMAQGRFEGFRQTLAHVFTHLEPVHHHVDSVFVRLGEFRHRIQLIDRAIDAYPGKALGAQFGE